tara:strand:- start:5416 stop:5895 length:480 start_codon:yes stop_codon:yes gene_type:complete
MDFKFITMKKLTLISFLFISTVAYSQGNLQFNRVINLEYSKVLNGTTSNASDTGETLLETITLEENKVWKVVSAAITSGDRNRGDNPLYPYGNNVGLFINKTKIYQSMSSNAVHIQQNIQLPVWISSGSGTKNIIAYMAGTDQDPFTISISIIEFNIVQ